MKHDVHGRVTRLIAKTRSNVYDKFNRLHLARVISRQHRRVKRIRIKTNRIQRFTLKPLFMHQRKLRGSSRNAGDIITPIIDYKVFWHDVHMALCIEEISVRTIKLCKELGHIAEAV